MRKVGEDGHNQRKEKLKAARETAEFREGWSCNYRQRVRGKKTGFVRTRIDDRQLYLARFKVVERWGITRILS